MSGIVSVNSSNVHADLRSREVAQVRDSHVAATKMDTAKILGITALVLAVFALLGVIAFTAAAIATANPLLLIGLVPCIGFSVVFFGSSPAFFIPSGARTSAYVGGGGRFYGGSPLGARPFAGGRATFIPVLTPGAGRRP